MLFRSLIGLTNSPDFPITQGAVQPTFQGSFVSKLNMNLNIAVQITGTSEPLVVLPTMLQRPGMSLKHTRYNRWRVQVSDAVSGKALQGAKLFVTVQSSTLERAGHSHTKQPSDRPHSWVIDGSNPPFPSEVTKPTAT